MQTKETTQHIDTQYFVCCKKEMRASSFLQKLEHSENNFFTQRAHVPPLSSISEGSDMLLS